MKNFIVLMLLLCVGTEIIAQTITNKPGYPYSGNFDYKLYKYQQFNTMTSVGVMGLNINDPGGDGKPTTVTDITFSFSAATAKALNAVAIFSLATGKVISPFVVVANGSTSSSFNLSPNYIVVADGAITGIELRATFKTTIIDNQQMQFTVSSVTALAGGSIFTAPDGGGATSPVTGDINKISVTADRYKFGQQPTDVFAGQIMSPPVTVKAIDVNNNVDSDYVSSVKLILTNPIPSCDTLSGNLVQASSGIATFATLASNVAEYGKTLTATGSLTSTVSSTFNVNSAQYKTLIWWKFSKGNPFAESGTNTDYATKSLSTTAGNISFGSCNCLGDQPPSAYTTGWDNGLENKYWQVDFSTLGYWKITVYFDQRSSATGPRDFKLQYKIGSDTWKDASTSIPALADSFKTTFINLPPIDTPAQVYLRWMMNSNTNVLGGIVDNAGQSYIDNIKIIGVAITLAKQLYFRSNGSGDFESSCNWETATSSSGPWSRAKGTPDFTANKINIRAGHTIAVNQSISLDETVVDSLGTLILNNGDMHFLNGGSVSGLYIKGTFIDNTSGSNAGSSFGAGATWKLDPGATFIKTNNSSAVPYSNNYFGGMSAIPPTANWIIRYTGQNSPSFITDGSFYPNLIFESNNGKWDPGATAGSYFSGGTTNGAFATIQGNLDIGGTGTGTVKINNINTNAQPMLIKGNTIIRAGSELNDSIGSSYGTGIEIKGNLTVDGVLSVNGGGKGVLKLSGITPQTLSAAGTLNIQNLSIANSGGGVTIANDITVAGTDSLFQGVLDPGINTLTLNGPIIRNSGSINGTQNTTILHGSIPQIIPSNAFLNNTIKNLTITNNVSLAGQDSITGTLSVGGINNTFTTNDNLTLKSTASGTANVGAIPVDGLGNPLDFITGKVSVERFISGKRAWRFLSVPTQTTESFHQAWQENMPQGSITQTTPAGYGTQITDAVTPTPANGFDYFSPNGPSVKRYDPATNTYIGIPNTNAAGGMASNEGWMTFIRGDRTAAGLYATSLPTVLRTKGPLKTSLSVPASTNLFKAIGNPYAAALDMSKITPAQSFFYIWDPKLAGTGFGAFQTFYYDNSAGMYVPINPSGSYLAPPYYISSGLAFFVPGPGILNITESSKATSPVAVNAFRPATGNPVTTQLRTNFYAIESDSIPSLVDAALEQYDGIYSDAIDEFDAIKLKNFYENLAIKTDSQLLAIERKHTIRQTDTIHLNMLKLKVKSYRFEFIGQNFDPSLTAFLEDSADNGRIPLDINGRTIYDFKVTQDSAMWNPARFRIVFAAQASGPLPLTFSSVKAYQQNKDIAVVWKVENEKNIRQYEVEKSADGQHFTLANIAAAKLNNSGSVNYQWLDVNAFTGTNYYKIKSVDINGETYYTNIVKVVMGKEIPQILVYPNPVSDDNINLQFVNQPKGKYGIRILDNLGQVILQRQIAHAEGSSTETFKIKLSAHEAYKVEITKPDNTRQNIHVLY